MVYVPDEGDLRPRLLQEASEAAGNPVRRRGVHRTSKPERPSGCSFSTETSSTPALDGPLRHQSTIWRTASGSPSNTASTRPSWRFWTQPFRPSCSAWLCVAPRKLTPCTSPETKTCTRSSLAISTLPSSHSSLRFAVSLPMFISVWGSLAPCASLANHEAGGASFGGRTGHRKGGPSYAGDTDAQRGGECPPSGARDQGGSGGGGLSGGLRKRLDR